MKELSLNVLDIAQNSIKAGAAHLSIRLEQIGNRLTITILDDGRGMPPEFLQIVTDPFTTTRTTRKVGMGLPLFKLAAEQTGGTLNITSKQQGDGEEMHGTCVVATFLTDHMDCAPIGDMTSTILTLLQGSPTLGLTYAYVTENGEKHLSTDEMRDTLGEDIPLDAPEVLAWVRDYLDE
ncbi:MAG: ATP-binding protein [Clostridia bacterium]